MIGPVDSLIMKDLRRTYTEKKEGLEILLFFSEHSQNSMPSAMQHDSIVSTFFNQLLQSKLGKSSSAVGLY